ncbi:MAG: hypothetical protein HY263_02455 [Chloroflexi bacterium]|nr:hypothetical protein [Chloroflexota bacterium]
MERRLNLAIPALAAVVLLMAAASVVAATSIEQPLCNGVKLRTGPSTSDTARAVTDTTTLLTVETTVSGSAWSSLCGGHVISGATWAKISAVDGTTVQSRYGVQYLYAAAGLLKVVGSPSPTVSPSHPPTAPPTAPPTPTPAPTTATPAPTEPAPTAAPPTPAVSPIPQTSSVATVSPTHGASAVAGGPVGNQGSGPSNALIGPAAVALLLAAVSTALTWFAVAGRRRRRASRVRVPESVPASRLEDVLH